ncbi:Endo-beta-mannanase [Pseudomonas putida]|uniref:glycoside hydrolase family 5 protein n=1 Tax=Pseudomonas TaxID=286 RepID=UPI0018D9AC1F|nr:cellulase family glycosylhydrolase [Pseudomonas guariconensis]CAB5560644.1 Endo-beta-mannanase [Pseudomonas putida]MBH3359847.1 cellulase family glycosylhydrolase [Pseudomonas guariconensis]MCO7622314.1 glycoside hydrolase family 5 protein [Pseudomonas guariconensis]MEB3842731.1 glycoside hydrolase family 5 protein [Pseudomonas guariconensis]MEB3875599.1 glycoside hydrolase family 5 protein [Pseudomonas guariconensis]
MRHWMFASLLALASLPANAADLIDFWNSPRHGGNSFNRLPPDRSYFQALSGYGATWVRLSYDKWKPQGRDFLLGDADAYKGLSPQDLAQLKTVLDNAHAAGLKVVIAPLSLPGMRWSQNNQGQFDDRLWRDKRYWTQAATFWHDLAQELKDHPAVAAYNLINEPAPERHGGLAEHAELQRMQQWYAGEQGGPRDLPALYRELVAAIREVDATTPIMVDAGWYAAADAFGYWPTALPDRRVLYSVHMYEPYSATSAPNMARKQPIPYPGPAPFGGKRERWDGERVAAYLQKPLDWADAVGVPRSRLVVGEFGCMRRLAGCKQYLEDVLTVLDKQQLHWAFYSFREDNWDGMDYELGAAKVPWRYWQAIEKGEPDPLARQATAEFEPIRRRLAP